MSTEVKDPGKMQVSSKAKGAFAVMMFLGLTPQEPGTLI